MCHYLTVSILSLVLISEITLLNCCSSCETENKQSVVPGKCVKEEKDGEGVLQQCKNSVLVANSTEQGSTLRDLLTTTAGKLKLGSTDAGIAFAPVYSTAAQVS